MENYQFLTLIGLLAAGFGWIITWLRSIDKQLSDIDTRLTVIETILSMMGMPVKFHNKNGTEH